MMNRTVGDLVHNHRVVALPPTASARDAARRMRDEHVASVVVTDEGAHAVGIFTERDLTDRVVAGGLDPDSTLLGSVMTRCPVTTALDTSVGDALRCMTVNTLRHLPVVADGRVVGLISMRDFVGDELAMIDREKDVMETLTERL
ncbi:cyclic nucleotide-binding/CBS domain-containing protein [Azospirillum griseum]|uniref:CBS domain-containing protein n=1 Tax=Azospirillum griseum TaxID=2496639 RepID=A0A431VGE8_9PROT|nr:CBS domain-containing protein [Azospirillum griseum]RTR19193.1 CBS domain-containing protein [Azospirillum griseum]